MQLLFVPFFVLQLRVLSDTFNVSTTPGGSACNCSTIDRAATCDCKYILHGNTVPNASKIRGARYLKNEGGAKMCGTSKDQRFPFHSSVYPVNRANILAEIDMEI